MYLCEIVIKNIKKQDRLKIYKKETRKDRAFRTGFLFFIEKGGLKKKITFMVFI